MAFSFGAPRFAGGLFFLWAAAAAASDPPALSNTFDSPEALARAVLAAIEREDVETLKRLPLTREEFQVHVWPKLPASRPERGMPFDYVWGDLSQKSRAAIAENYARYKRRRLELLSLSFKGESTDYGSFLVHRKSELRVREEKGGELSLELFGSVLEQKGRYKLFSYVTD